MAIMKPPHGGFPEEASVANPQARQGPVSFVVGSPLGINQNLVNNGINYQPQLVRRISEPSTVETI